MFIVPVSATICRDAIVPVTAIHVLAPLIPGDAATKEAAQKQRQVRKWLQQLISGNMLLGSFESGVHAHGTLRSPP
jgi:hypothetical protein